MATAAPSLTSTNQILKEYKQLLTYGRITKLSATRTSKDLAIHPGLGYPWFLFDPTLNGFQTAKSYYLSSADRFVNGYPETVMPNNIQEAYGKCIPWSNLTVPSSASYINQAFIKNCQEHPFWFYIMPPVSGSPIPVVIHYPKITNSNIPEISPTNHWLLAPNCFELDSSKITLWKTTTGVAIETYTENKTLRHDSASPALTSFYWIESFLGYVSLLSMPRKARERSVAPISFKFKGASKTAQQNSLVVNYPTNFCGTVSDVFDVKYLQQAKSHSSTYSQANYIAQLKNALTSSGILTKSFEPGYTAVKRLSSFYTVNTYPTVADIRTMFDFLTGEKYKWNTPVTYAGVMPAKADIIFRQGNPTIPVTVTPTLCSSLLCGLPRPNYNNSTSNWPQQVITTATRRSMRNYYTQIIHKHLAHWRTLTAIPLTARNLFDFNPALNTMVITIKPVLNLFNYGSTWTLYHPILETWVSYASAPGHAFFNQARLLSTANFTAYNKLSSLLLSAIDLTINEPDFIKETNTSSHYGKYETYITKGPVRNATIKELSSTGSFPLSSLTILSPITYITDYTTDTIYPGRVLSGTVFFTASATIPLNVNGIVQNVNYTQSQFKNKRNAKIILPPTQVAVRTPVLVLSGSTVRTTANNLQNPDTSTLILGILGSTGTITQTNILSSEGSPTPISVYAIGNISDSLFRAVTIYKNIKWECLGLTTKDSVEGLLNRPGSIRNNIKSLYPIVPKSFVPPSRTAEVIPSLDMRNVNYEVIQLQSNQVSVGTIGLHPYDFNGNNYSFTNIHRPNNKQVRGPYNLQPTVVWPQQYRPIRPRGESDGRLHWPITKYRRKNRSIIPTFNRQRRKRVLGF